jgi:REP element-mobilizing transposase RayT
MAIIDQQKTEYERFGQPHYQHIGATFSVTIAAHDAIPEALLQRVKKRKRVVLEAIDQDNLPDKQHRKQDIHERYYAYIEELLHRQYDQEHVLRNPLAAAKLEERIRAFDGEYYNLLAFSIMSNHAHLQLDFSAQCPQGWDWVSPLPDYVNLATVLGKLKGGSAYDINKEIGRKGKLWRPGYYGRYMRNRKHLVTEFWYILRNPEKAGLVKSWRDHPFTFGHPTLVGFERGLAGLKAGEPARPEGRATG